MLFFLTILEATYYFYFVSFETIYSEILIYSLILYSVNYRLIAVQTVCWNYLNTNNKVWRYQIALFGWEYSVTFTGLFTPY